MNKKLKELSLGTKILIPVVMLLLIGNSFYAYVAISKMNTLAFSNQKKSLEMLGESIFKTLKTAMNTGDPATIKAAEDDSRTIKGLEQLIVAKSKKTLQLYSPDEPFTKNKDILEAFETKKKSVLETAADDSHTLRIINPMIATQECIACHINQQEGDVIGVMDLTFSLNETDAIIHVTSFALMGIAALLLIIIALSIKYVVKSITTIIATAVGQISTAGEQVVAASEEVASSALKLSESASDQAASVEEITATVEQTRLTIEQTAANSKEADILGADTSHSAQEGHIYIKKLLSSMEEITDSSKKIENIIKTIDELAFQTNLLALNAAVEAARAGEHGLGFAVVADEVKSLADKSAQAAKETAAIIEHSLTQVENGNKIAIQTNQAFEEIFEKVTTSSNLVSKISSASKDQNGGMQQISKAMVRIDQVTQAVASASEESASSSEKLSVQAVSMEDSILAIARLVGHEADIQKK